MDSQRTRHVRVWGMRTGISIRILPADRLRLQSLVKDSNAPQKHVWSAEIVLLSASGAGGAVTQAITPQTCRLYMEIHKFFAT
jgi:hypothetical protein